MVRLKKADHDWMHYLPLIVKPIQHTDSYQQNLFEKQIKKIVFLFLQYLVILTDGVREKCRILMK